MLHTCAYLLRLVAHFELVKSTSDAIVIGKFRTYIWALFNLVAPGRRAYLNARLGGIGDTDEKEDEDQWVQHYGGKSLLPLGDTFI